jgi:hypothetical protein
MNYKYLIDASKTHLEKYPGYEPARGFMTMFASGARWMYDRLVELDERSNQPWDPAINYNLYGFLKYGICVAGFFLSCWWFSAYSPLLAPCSILVFYLCEIQFLFLFPLLIDHSRQPILSGIREVFKIGIFKCLCTVIPIAFFMMMGLFHKRGRYRNWDIGCLAILIWYKDEVRTRL